LYVEIICVVVHHIEENTNDTVIQIMSLFTQLDIFEQQNFSRESIFPGLYVCY